MGLVKVSNYKAQLRKELNRIGYNAELVDCLSEWYMLKLLQEQLDWPLIEPRIQQAKEQDDE